MPILVVKRVSIVGVTRRVPIGRTVMTPGINLQQTLSRTMLAVGDEPQLVYVLLKRMLKGWRSNCQNCR
jgi:hypothetical protein